MVSKSANAYDGLLPRALLAKLLLGATSTNRRAEIPISSTNRRACTRWGSRSPLSSAASPSRRRSPSSMATRYQTRRQSTRRSPLALLRPLAFVTRSCRPNALTPAPATLDPSNSLNLRDVHTACVRPTWVGESAARLGTRQSLNRRTSRDLAWTFAPTSYGSWCPPTPSSRGCRTSAPRSRRARLSCCGEAWCEHRQQSRHSTQHAARMVHARCMPSVRVAYVLGRRRTMAGTCATVGGSYRPSGSPRARPRCSGTRSPRRCTPRRCNAAGSECLGSQRPVAAHRSG